MPEVDEIKKILTNHEKRILELEKLFKKKPSELKSKQKKSITDLIIEIKNEGFFNKPKQQREIVERFEEMGFIYDTKSISDPLSRALRSRIIGRKKISGKWAYVNR